MKKIFYYFSSKIPVAFFQAPINERLGRKCLIPSREANGRQSVQLLRENSFQIKRARLFNCLTKKLRDFRYYQDDFKSELYEYLSTVPDQPPVGSLIPEEVCQVTCKQSNSLTAWVHETRGGYRSVKLKLLFVLEHFLMVWYFKNIKKKIVQL